MLDSRAFVLGLLGFTLGCRPVSAVVEQTPEPAETPAPVFVESEQAKVKAEPKPGVWAPISADYAELYACWFESPYEYMFELRFIGKRERFSPRLQKLMRQSEALTADNTTATCVIAADYGGRWDIAEAAATLARRVRDGELAADDITPELLGEHGIPVVPTLWPDQLDDQASRRLQLAAEKGQSWAVAFRSLEAARTALPCRSRCTWAPSLRRPASARGTYGSRGWSLSEVPSSA